MLFRTSDTVEMSFPLRVVALAIGKEPTIEPSRLLLDQRSIPTDADHALSITFYGPRRTIRTISATSLLAGDTAPDDIQNRIVVVGTTVTGGGDFFPTPFEPVMPGVEVISTAITHLMAGDGILRDQSVRIADGVVAVMLPVVLVGLLAWRRSGVGIVAAATVVLVWATTVFFAFSRGIGLSAACQSPLPLPRLFCSQPFNSGQGGGGHSILPRGVSCSNNFKLRAYRIG
jgi:adenylate cyclase